MSVAKVYARALYAVIAEGRAPDEVAGACARAEERLSAIHAAVESSKEARTALYSPVTNVREKKAIVAQLARTIGAESLVERFVELMAAKGRLRALPEAIEELSSVRLREEGGVPGKLLSAEPIAESDLKDLSQAFSRKLGKKVAFQVRTDPSLLAGVRVTVGGVTYDGTLRVQLQRLRDRLLAPEGTA